VDVPDLRAEVKIARRGSTLDQDLEEWALGYLNTKDPDEDDSR
jgi:hypothetical protein